MADLEAIEVLTQAKERLFECGWGKYNSEHRADGSMCVEEAILGLRGHFVNCSGRAPHLRAANYINATLGRDIGRSLFPWNDGQHSAGPVFDAIDDAIAAAKEAPYPAS